MKEATGEVSMTVVTLVAISVIGAVLALMWPTIKNTINNLWQGGNNQAQCQSLGKTWDSTTGQCK